MTKHRLDKDTILGPAASVMPSFCGFEPRAMIAQTGSDSGCDGNGYGYDTAIFEESGTCVKPMLMGSCEDGGQGRDERQAAADTTNRVPAAAAPISQVLAPDTSFAVISATCRPWKRAPASSFSLGIRSPLPPAMVDAP